MLPHRIRTSEASKTELQWNMECKKPEHGKPNAIKDGMNQLHADIIGICKFKWTGIGYFQLEGHTWNGIAFICLCCIYCDTEEVEVNEFYDLKPTDCANKMCCLWLEARMP